MAQTFFQRLVSIVLLVPALAFAWEPTKPIEVTIAHTPGTVNELVARALIKEVEQNTQAKFFVMNRPGAGGAVGTIEFSTKPADGHYVNMISIPGLAAMDKIAVPTKSYGVDSFEYPFIAAQSPFVIITNPKNPVNSTQGFITDLKTQKVSVSANGGARVVYELLKLKTGFPEDMSGVVRVDHKSPVEAMADVVSNNVTYAIIPALVANAFIQDGKVKAIAVTSASKISQLSNVPTLSSSVPGFVVLGTWGFVLPKNTPQDVIEWYNIEFTKALKSPEVQRIYKANLLEPTPYSTPKSYENFVKAQEKLYQPVVDLVLSRTNK
jgi:tripartite-type tricarboxylate transporter receptor subunit TctC